MVLAAALFGGVALVFALPALSQADHALWGDSGDAWQNLWNGWWFGRALAEGHSPFFTPLLWHPEGVSLWLQTFGPLNAAATALLQGLLPGYVGYDLVVLLHLAFGGLGAWLLCDVLLARSGVPEGAGRFVAAAAGGLVFGFSPYVWSHVSVHLHLTSIGFLPLFAVTLLRAESRPGPRSALLAGVAALTLGLCGWYLVLDAALLGVVFAAAAAIGVRRRGLRPRGGLAAAGLASALLLLPVLLPTLAALREPVEGSHDPVVFSADLLSPFVPAPRQWLGRFFLETTRRFTGNDGENGGYLGYAALLLTGVGLVRHPSRPLWVLVAAGALGLLLSFGPHPHLGGTIDRQVRLPYAFLAEGVPLLDALGCPVRLSLLANLALGAGAAHGTWVVLEAVRRRRWRRPRAAWAVAALACGIVPLVEYAPAGQPTHRYPEPAFLRALGTASTGAVADLTGWTHPLFNQTLHGRPLVHGYTSRRPLRLVRRLLADPVLGPLYEQALYGRAPLREAVRRVDGPLAFDWGAGAPLEDVAPDFEAEWSGFLEVPAPGTYHFQLGSDDDARLYVDGRLVVDNGGAHPYRTATGSVRLTGRHALRLTFRDRGGDAALMLAWRAPGARAFEPVPREALRTPDGRPGLEGIYRHRVARPRRQGPEAWRHLRQVWEVDHVIAYSGPLTIALAELGLTRVARGDGLELWRVPEPPPEPRGPGSVDRPSGGRQEGGP